MEKENKELWMIYKPHIAGDYGESCQEFELIYVLDNEQECQQIINDLNDIISGYKRDMYDDRNYCYKKLKVDNKDKLKKHIEWLEQSIDKFDKKRIEQAELDKKRKEKEEQIEKLNKELKQLRGY